jgi:hypothetical protein
MPTLSLRPVIAALLSVSIALSALGVSASPARADNNREAAAVIGGLIALYAIGRAIERHNNRSDPAPVHVAPRQQHRIIPQHCYIEGYNGNHFVRGYVRRCMINNVAQPHLLPQNCLRHVQTHRGPRNIYARHCLQQNGWVTG